MDVITPINSFPLKSVPRRVSVVPSDDDSTCTSMSFSSTTTDITVSSSSSFKILVDVATFVLIASRIPLTTHVDLGIQQPSKSTALLPPSATTTATGERALRNAVANKSKSKSKSKSKIKSKSKSKSKGKNMNKKQSFAQVLMTVLDNPVHEDILTWMPDGRAFTILNHKLFTKTIMPRLFHIHNMSSFVRKLARLGFRRVHEKQSCNSDIFKHPSFQRGGDWDLV